MHFEKTVIGQLDNSVAANAWMNTMIAVGDVDGDGRPDVVVSGRRGQCAWYRNPGGRAAGAWEKRLVAEVEHIECGGSVVDLTGNGRGDLILGGDGGSDAVWWHENPGDGRPWPQHLICRTGQRQFHDTLIGMTARDTRPALYFSNQGGGTSVYRLPLPADPRVSPWPGLERISAGKGVINRENPWNRSPEPLQGDEGLVIGDVDNDGQNEIVCGNWWFKWDGAAWREYRWGGDYITTKLQIADIDGDGRNEIIAAEGDACCYGKAAARMGWFKPGANIHEPWIEHRLADDLIDPHSLRVADLNGDGRPDIFVGELGQLQKGTDNWRGRAPELFILENDGRANFTRHVVDHGTGTHDAHLVDMDGDGKLDIVGRPLFGAEKWNVHVFYRR